MIFLALVASESQLQACKLGVCIGVQTKLLHINSISNSEVLILSLFLIFGTNLTLFKTNMVGFKFLC